MSDKNITIIYYKCSCGCRVGISTECGYKVPYNNLTGKYLGNPNKTFEYFYCNNCKCKTPHIYCGYKTVEK